MAVELPILEALYVVQKLIEPLPGKNTYLKYPEEVTITVEDTYLKYYEDEKIKVCVIIYVKAEHLETWAEAVDKIRKENDAIAWEVF
jgi:hypothetical protein